MLPFLNKVSSQSNNVDLKIIIRSNVLGLYDCVPVFNLAFRSSRLLVMLVLLYHTTIPTSSRRTSPTAVEEGENTV